MPLLASKAYDPETAVTNKAATAALAMTALDTTNLRVTFKAPTNGRVLVRIKCQASGASELYPRILLGVLEGSTLKGRQSPIGHYIVNSTTIRHMAQEAIYIVAGLEPGKEYTWDAAYGVEVVQTSANLKYGGPNNTTENDAWGAFSFEVWSAVECLAGTLYDPTSAVEKTTGETHLALAAFDTTNLRLSFVAPASGNALWRINCQAHGATTLTQFLLGVLEGATVKGRQSPLMGNPMVLAATSTPSLEASAVVTGLESGKEYTWDAAWGTEKAVKESKLKYGGPNNTTANDAFGGVAFEIWKA